MYEIIYEDKETFEKLQRALKKYEMLLYKYLMFKYIPELKDGNFLGQVIKTDKENKSMTCKLNLPTNNLFKQVHGEIALIYTRHNKTITLNEIQPKKVFLESRKNPFPSYRGVIANNEKDKFKIDILNMIYDD